MPDFLPGLKLCGAFYEEAVKPILDSAFPGLQYSAARIGSGSDILGFDTEMSMDHDWGPSVLLFLHEADAARIGEAVREAVSVSLPLQFQGFATRYITNEDSSRTLEPNGATSASHRVETTSVRAFYEAYLGLDIHSGLEPADWLSFPEQKLLGISAGAIYHDGIGLEAVRARFAYYPRDVWLYLLAAGWNRVGQEEHLMGRAGFVGDEIGSALIGARLVRDIMRLCFLMERQYAPYPKWLGSAFRRLRCGPALEPHLLRALRAPGWREREEALSCAYRVVAQMHNALRLAAPLPEATRGFHNRPFRVIHLEADFAGSIAAQIEDPSVRLLASRRLLGSIDQISDNTDLLCGAEWRSAIRGLYE